MCHTACILGMTLPYISYKVIWLREGEINTMFWAASDTLSAQ